MSGVEVDEVSVEVLGPEGRRKEAAPAHREQPANELDLARLRRAQDRLRDREARLFAY